MQQFTPPLLILDSVVVKQTSFRKLSEGAAKTIRLLAPSATETGSRPSLLLQFYGITIVITMHLDLIVFCNNVLKTYVKKKHPKKSTRIIELSIWYIIDHPRNILLNVLQYYE